MLAWASCSPMWFRMQVDLAGSGTKCTWLDVASAASSAIMQFSGPGTVCLAALSACLGLLECLAVSYPLRVLAAVQRMPLFSPSESAGRIMSGEAQLKAAIPFSNLSAYDAEAGSEYSLHDNFLIFLDALDSWVASFLRRLSGYLACVSHIPSASGVV